MKQERNCGASAYPVYPAYPNPGMNPGIPPMMPGQNIGMPNNIEMPTVPNNNIIDNNLMDQINNLEKRVSRLEDLVISNNKTPKYNESNYYMV